MGGVPAGRLRIGTRGSALALTQTEAVVGRLAAILPNLAIEPVVIRTEGDVDKTSPLTVIGGRGVFTSALQDALRRGEIDAAVHSAKDLPSEEPSDLVLAAFPEREDPRDVLVSRHGSPLAQLPPTPAVGTSSRRRATQVRARRPDARIVELRGNVDTRLRKALTTEVDAIVLAAAGVRRMGWRDRITEVLPLDGFVPSPGQGALAVEARRGDEEILALLAAIDDPAVSRAVRVERAFLRAIGGGCTTPVGAHVERDGERLRLRAMLASEDGERVEWADERLGPGSAEAAAAEIAVAMLARVRAAGGTTFGYRSTPGRDAGPAAGRPLAGLTVLVTRARAQAATLVDALRREGAEPLELPTIRVEDPIHPAPLDAALARLRGGAYDWVVFTSANGVEKTLARLDRTGAGGSALAAARVAAVGPATAAALTAAGVVVDLVPEWFAAEAIVAALATEGIAGRRVLYPRADIARDALAEGLRAAGATVDAVDAYRTVPETTADPAALARVRRGEVDIATFASGSSVRNLVALLGGDLDGLRRATVACVGASTAAAAREFGLDVAIVAEDSTIPGLVTALVHHRAGRPADNGARDGRGPGRVLDTEMVGARGGGVGVTFGFEGDGVAEESARPPLRRLRRLRRSEAVRRLVRETELTPADFIYPLFVTHGVGVRHEIGSMPGQFQLSVDELPAELAELAELGIGAVLLFGIPADKDSLATSAHDPQGVVQEAVRLIKREAPDLLVITDVCACEYTDHGHCGVLVECEVDNDRTLELLARIALSHAEAGADVVAPSDMMDGRVAAIRAALDAAGHPQIAIMSYAAKYASAFYGPFREAAASMPAFGDRRSHQMDPANAREALVEIATDLDEGADVIIVKPALAYLDVVRRARDAFDAPLIAYNVSGEYAMVKAAGRLGWVDERRVTLETLTAIKRAGAGRIITYHAKEAARWLREDATTGRRALPAFASSR